ncbi:MAG: ABC transporter ATP-binding protein [Cryomorphaceae bacterium]|nr:ABC transporter ATP-binding protein [Cryomorphaceae bacterium]
MIEAKGIFKSFGSLAVLKDVQISVSRGEVVSLAGASGAGKTTLLQILGTLDYPDQGSVTLEGQNVFLLSEKALSDFRNRRIGFVFQFHHLLPEFTAWENIAIPAMIAGKSKEAAKEKAMGLLGLIGLKDRADHRPGELSGGECQRVAVARALVNDPAIILADEPTGSLDSKNALQIHELFLKLRNELGQTFLIITHNEKLAQMADRTIHIKDGQIAE